MAKLMLMTPSEEEKVHTITLDMDPFNGEVEIDVVPKTRRLVLLAEKKAKRNPIYNRHTAWDAEKGKNVSVPGRPDDAFVEELAKLLVRGWRGVIDPTTGVDADCSDENKALLFNNVEVSNYVIRASGELAASEAKEDEKNS